MVGVHIVVYLFFMYVVHPSMSNHARLCTHAQCQCMVPPTHTHQSCSNKWVSVCVSVSVSVCVCLSICVYLCVRVCEERKKKEKKQGKKAKQCDCDCSNYIYWVVKTHGVCVYQKNNRVMFLFSQKKHPK